MIQDLWKSNEQRNLAPLSVPGASSAGSIRVVSGSGFRYVVPFPYRLHEMLSNVDAKHDSSVVSWLPDGKHFKVHDPRRFVECVIPSAFKQKSLKSFQRQLHLYGFQRVHEGVDKGAYYHDKFRRDDRDLCLTITRTKAPKRSRSTPMVRKDKMFSQKLPVFHSPKNTHCDTTKNSNFSSAPVPNTNISAIVIAPTIFDDVSPLQQSSLISENNCNMNRPLHKATVSSTMLLNIPSSSKSDHQSSSSTSYFEETYNTSLPLQLKSHQPLEGSIADTCQWLINAGVPISAFDPVAIGDISHSTFSVPQLVTSTSSFSPVISQESIIPETVTGSMSSRYETTAVEKNETEPLRFNQGIAATCDVNSLLSGGLPGHNPLSLSSTFQDGVAPFDSETLLTDLLPGENLPMVDDLLWAL